MSDKSTKDIYEKKRLKNIVIQMKARLLGRFNCVTDDDTIAECRARSVNVFRLLAQNLLKAPVSDARRAEIMKKIATRLSSFDEQNFEISEHSLV